MASGALALSGCNRGYQTAAELESAERGPTHCARSCYDLGMRMSAFVLVDRGVAGCVCEPVQAPAGPYPAPPPAGAPPPPAGAPPPPPPAAGMAPAPQPQSRASAGAAAGYAVIQAHRQQQEEQQALRATQSK
ncbi:hypothetical protein [Sorangium sp. So ce1182]|uniref:hypothetical protein n=1 Tax=Sorangium sp. So ce1182 TaxID=3133334 RepID=UPI003F602D34